MVRTLLLSLPVLLAAGQAAPPAAGPAAANRPPHETGGLTLPERLCRDIDRWGRGGDDEDC